MHTTADLLPRTLDRALAIAISLTAAAILVEFSTLSFGASDRVWVGVYLGSALTGLGAALWWRRRPSPRDADAEYALRRWIRACLTFLMIWYGVMKLLPAGQFGEVPLHVLDQPFRSISPFWLAWGYLGFGSLQEVVLGLAEITCGVLLAFDRTERLGLVLITPVIVNIILVNYVFSVSVLGLALVMLVMAGYLLLVHVPWALASFWTHRAAVPVEAPPLSPRVRRWTIGWTAAVIVLAAGQNLYLEWAHPLTRSPVHGAWRVESGEGAGVRYYFDYFGEGRIAAGDSLRVVSFDADSVSRRLLVREPDGGDTIVSARFELRDSGRVLLLRRPVDSLSLRRIF